jgi:hypothetical protein
MLIYLPLPSEVAEVPVLELAVAGRSPATVLFVPGTTVLPVAPGTCGLRAAALGAGAVTFASAECCVDDLVSAVGGVAVIDLLLPKFAVGLFPWASAVRGAARIVAASIEFRNIDVIVNSRL